MDPIVALILLFVFGSFGWKMLKLSFSGVLWVITRIIGLTFLVLLFALIAGRC